MANAEGSPFDVRLGELTSALADLVDLLRTNEAEHWAGWAERVLAGGKTYDAGAFDQLLGAYGGMGSFNDLVLGSWSVSPAPDDVREINNRLDALRTTCCSLASDLRLELRRT